ncbi:MAG TPA: FG-GAP-like repeat-containing protein, partial [Kofleriaceae bacterium]
MLRSRHVLFPLLLAAGLAHAGVDHTGQLAEEVRIEVPAFHGITPAVALRYASDGGNGFAGVGWRLDTAPVITRVSASRGIPRGDASDRYLLDGQELVACGSGSPSPSCTTAITAFGSSANFFSTRIESYERIRREAAGWTLWRRDGTKVVFNSEGRVDTVTDTHGNQVRYTWWCDEACYPDSITYADRPGFPGAQIRFVREDRPDKLSAGRGSGTSFLRTKHRLHAIEVRMHGQLLRAYQLGYTQSLANGASIASTIQQFGRDALVSSSGVYSPGPTPAMPALALTTPSMASAGTRASTVITNNGLTAMTETRVPFASHFTGDQVSYNLAYNVDIDGEHPRPHGQTIGDFNGDGRVDWLKWSVTSKDCTALQINATLMTKTGKKASVRSNLTGVGPSTSIWPIIQPCFLGLHVADVDGDRRDDLLVIGGGKLKQLKPTPNGGFVLGSVQTWPAANEQRCSTGDLDGDNRVDVACTSVVNGSVQLAIARSQGDGTWSITNDPLTGLGVADIATHRLAMGDFTGDGLADVTIATKVGTTWTLLAGRSDGLGQFAWSSQATAWTMSTSATLAADDVDGDGKSDVMIVQGSGVYTALSAKGNTARYRILGGYGFAQETLAIGDHDGDGRADLLLQSTQRWALGRGDGTFAPPPADVALPGCDAALDEVAIIATDLNGDGRSDILCTFDDGIVTLRDRMAGVLPGASAHGWLQADITGDGITELLYITPLAPRGYRITVVTTETQQRTFYDVTNVPGTQTTFTTLDEPDTQRFFAMDVGSASGAPDGKADLVLVDETGGALRIYTFLSTGAGFTAIVDLPGTYSGTDLESWQPGQIDGDGRGDLIRPVLSSGGIAVESLRARGDGHWDVVASPLKFSGMNLTTPGLIVVDISGDGLSDIVHAQCCNLASGGSVLRSLLRNSDGTFSERTMTNWGFFRDLRRLKVGDVNGDGLADLVHITTTGSTANLQIYASDGNGDFQYRAQTVSWPVGTAEDANLLEDTSLVRLIDIDGDRRTDFIHIATYVDNTGQRRTAILTAQAPDSNASVWPAQLVKGLAFAAYDLDPWRWQPWTEPLTGDGGLLYVHPTQSQAYLFRAARDRVSRIANGRGGVTNITYSSLWGARTYLPEGSLPRVVTAVETRDEAHTPAVSETASYFYGEARYSIALGELGFGWIQRNEPDSRELTFSTLDDQCGARPWKVMQLDATHALQAYSIYSYVAPGGTPYTCDRQVTDNYECDATSCRFARSESLTLDEYGNAVAIAVSSDRAVATLTYAPPNANAAAYLVDKPSYVAHYDVTPGGPALRSATIFAYDTQPGRLGDLLVAARYDGTAVPR